MYRFNKPNENNRMKEDDSIKQSFIYFLQSIKTRGKLIWDIRIKQFRR